jgi:hypothetical protein
VYEISSKSTAYEFGIQFFSLSSRLLRYHFTIFRENKDKKENLRENHELAPKKKKILVSG